MDLAVLLDIDGIRDPSSDSKLFDYLVVDESIKSTIKSLALTDTQRPRGKDGKVFSAEFIRGKGEGQVFLLHGGPGVDKNSAAGIILKELIPCK